MIVTRTEPALCTSAPTTGLNTSVVARTVAKKFNPMEKVRFRYANGLMIDMDRVVWYNLMQLAIANCGRSMF